MTLSQAKTLGGVGSVLVILSVLPAAGPVLGIAGLVLVLIAVKNISDALGNRTIFNNMVMSTILAIIGIIAGFLVIFASLFAGIFQGGFPGPGPLPFPGRRFFELVLSVIAGLAIVWVFLIASAVFLRRSFNTTASSLNIEMFSTAALLYLIGSILVIILVGFIVLFIAEILQAVAFFSVPEKPPQPRQPAQPAVSSTPT